MLNKIKSMLKSLRTATVNRFQRNKIVTREIGREWKHMAGSIFSFIAINIINVLAVVYGGGILYSGAIAGIVLIMSVVFVVAGATKPVQNWFVNFFGKYGFWFDVIATVVLTVAGFSLGTYLGITAMFMGLNISAGLCALRVVYFITRAQKAADVQVDSRVHTGPVMMVA